MGVDPDFKSAEFWEHRYISGGTSGAGSFGRLATFKADFLNAFVSANSIKSVIEFGTGNGVQTKLYDFPMYTGIDVAETAIAASRLLFAGSDKHQFLLSSELAQAHECDLSLSIDVLYHLVEDLVFDKYVRELFFFGNRYVVIYSSDDDAPSPAIHVRHRKISKFIAARFPEWRHAATVKNLYPFDIADQNNTTFSDFLVFVRRGQPCTLVVPPIGELG
jgi:hypothetical protein